MLKLMRYSRFKVPEGALIWAVLWAISVPLYLLAEDSATAPSPGTVLQALVDGNNRFCAGHSLHPHQDGSRRKSLVAGQNPVATILSCSDSRAAPELIFDQGLGDLFVIRVAGNSLDDELLGSIEYAVEHLSSRLIVVMGHEKCGALTAAVQGVHERNHIDAFLSPLTQAVQDTKGMPGDPVDNAVRDNIRIVVDELKKSQPVLANLQKNGKLEIVGAEYHLQSGRVEFLK
jgi:carbonic anhydrase